MSIGARDGSASAAGTAGSMMPAWGRMARDSVIEFSSACRVVRSCARLARSEYRPLRVAAETLGSFEGLKPAMAASTLAISSSVDWISWV